MTTTTLPNSMTMELPLYAASSSRFFIPFLPFAVAAIVVSSVNASGLKARERARLATKAAKWPKMLRVGA